MTTHDKHIAQKKKEIEKIERQQARLLKQVAAISTTPSKRKDVNIRRIAKVLDLAMKARSLEVQKQIIISQPIPKEGTSFATGGVILSDLAIVRETGPEYIEWGEKRIYPNLLNKKP